MSTNAISLYGTESLQYKTSNLKQFTAACMYFLCAFPRVSLGFLTRQKYVLLVDEERILPRLFCFRSCLNESPYQFVVSHDISDKNFILTGFSVYWTCHMILRTKNSFWTGFSIERNVHSATNLDKKSPQNPNVIWSALLLQNAELPYHG